MQHANKKKTIKENSMISQEQIANQKKKKKQNKNL